MSNVDTWTITSVFEASGTLFTGQSILHKYQIIEPKKFFQGCFFEHEIHTK